MKRVSVSGAHGPLLMLAVLLAAAGCGRSETGSSKDQTAGSRTVPDSVSSLPPAAEAAALDRGPRAAESLAVAAPLAATGQMLFDAKGCTGCHTLGESGSAPDLRGVGARRTEAWLLRQMTRPEWMAEHDPLTRAMVDQYGVPMAALDVSADEATALLHYLVGEKGVD